MALTEDPWVRRYQKQFDRSATARALEADETKAARPSLPAGATAKNEAQSRTVAEQAGYQVDGFNQLPRTQPMVPFGPGVPLSPSAINPTAPEHMRPGPRQYEYDTSWNLPGAEQKHVPWRVLRDVADGVDVARACINARKSQIQSLSWDITVSPLATERIMDAGEPSMGRASQIARQELAGDLRRVRDFFTKPDRRNGLSFFDWIGMLLEEMYVTDAVTIYPQFTLGGDLHSLIPIDGSTIKPLLDQYGMVPQPPNPAYQQILNGFPRGEFVASPDGAVAGEYRNDRLLYRPRIKRVWSPYGFSLIEQALSICDLYLKRMAWMRDEFNEGALPSTFIKSDIKVSASHSNVSTGEMTPEQLKQMERILNDDLGGQNAERVRLVLLAAGMDPMAMSQMAEKYKPELDTMIIKIMCAVFEMMPTEIGFTPSAGLGGKSHSEGEETSLYRKAIRPTVVWLQNLINDLMWQFLGVSQELQFSFIGYEIEDQKQLAEQEDIELRNGSKTLNQVRAAKGQPLYDIPEADEPWVMTGAGVQMLRGLLDAQKISHETAEVELEAAKNPPEPAAPPIPPVAPPPEDPAKAPAPADAPESELKTFTAYAAKRAKRGQWRDFAFEHVPGVHADLLNAAGRAGDLDLVKSLVADVGKASPRRGWSAGAARTKITKTHAPEAHRILVGLFPTTAKLTELGAAVKGIDPTLRATIKANIATHVDDPQALAEEFDAIHDDGYDAGEGVAYELLDEDPDPEDATPTQTPPRLRDRARGAAETLVALYVGRLAVELLTGTDEDRQDRLAAVLDDPALTETTVDYQAGQAISAGAVDTYAKHGAAAEVVPDATACDLCDSASGPVDDMVPPFHPGCECEVLPVQEDA